MRQNIIRRLLESIAALVGVTFVIFIMLRVIPGNPIEAMMGEHANQATIDRMTAELGLDRPIYIQFIRYIAGALRGDFGTSYSLGKPVAALMRTAFVNTLRLSLLASAFAWVVGVVCGVISAVRKNGLEDHLFMGFSLLGVSVPVFMIAMLLQFCFGYYFHLLPISGSAG
jgi:peptide/nickel transport system permease protein